MRYTPWVISEHVPDLSTLDNLIKSPRFAGKRGQDLAIALFDYMVDRELGIFHYLPAMEPMWKRDTHDPLQVLNVYGFTICHVHANVLAMIYRAAGFPVRISNIKGHEGTEAWYDDAWHYYDCDIQMFYRLRPPRQNVVASLDDVCKDTTLITDQPNPSNPYHMPDRLPEKIVPLYEVEPTYSEVLDERMHSMNFHLRPGEEMTRYFHHRGRWVVFEHYPAGFRRFTGETGPEGPTERFWPRRQWGNGFYKYEPKLCAPYRDVELGADELNNVSTAADGLRCGAGRGHVTFAFESPYIFCGIPDPMGRVPGTDGAFVNAAFVLPAGGATRIEGALDRSDDWRELWSSKGQSGALKCEADFTTLAEANYRLRLRVVLEGAGARMESFSTRLWFMVSPHSLPALRNVGDNRMQLRCGDAFGLNTRTLQVQYRTDAPEASARAAKTVNLRHDPASAARLIPVDPAKPWEVVYELAAPQNGKMAWASVYTLIEGRKPGEPADPTPACIDIADSPDGPWRRIGEREIPLHPQGWHSPFFAEARFSGESAKGYVRFSARKGALGFRITGHYVPGGPAISAPLEIEHAWYEEDPRVGRRLRQHVEKTDGASHAYVVRCASTPHDERIVLRVPSVR